MGMSFHLSKEGLNEGNDIPLSTFSMSGSILLLHPPQPQIYMRRPWLLFHGKKGASQHCCVKSINL
eukprot:GSA25T00024008001.1